MIFELSDIDLVDAPANVSARARTEVQVLPLGSLIAQREIKIPRGKLALPYALLRYVGGRTH